MKLPATIEYAYKAILELAIRYNGNNPVQLSVISDSQGIPKKFLIQLLLRLKNANIVDTTRGAQGGYFLARSPSRISLADVFRAIDDTILAGPKKERPVKASNSEKLLFRIWADVAKDATRRLEVITFDKLTSEIKNEQLTYYI